MNLPSQWLDRLWSSLRYAIIATRRAIWHRYHTRSTPEVVERDESTVTPHGHTRPATLPLNSSRNQHSSRTSSHESIRSASSRRSLESKNHRTGSPATVALVASHRHSETVLTQAETEERRESGFWIWLVGLWLAFVQLVKRATSWEFATITGAIAAILALIFLITTEFTGQPKQLVAAAEPQVEATPEPIPEPEQEPLEPVSIPVEQPEEPDFPDFGDLFPPEDELVPEPVEPEPKENPFEFVSTPEPEPEPEPELEIETRVELVDPEPLLIANSIPIDESFDHSQFPDEQWTRMPFTRRERAMADTRLPAAYQTPEFLLRASRFGIRSDDPPASGDHSSDLEVIRSHRPGIASQEVVECTIRVTNHSEMTVTGAEIIESIPAEIRVTDCEPLAVLEDNQLTWKLEPLPAGESKTLTYRYYGTTESLAATETTLATTAKVEVVTRISGMKLSLQMSAPQTVSTNKLLPISFNIENESDFESSDMLLRLHLPPTLEHPYGQILDHEVAAIAPGKVHEAILHVRPITPTAAARVRAEIIHEGEEVDSMQVSTRIVEAPAQPRPKKKATPKPTRKLSVPEAPCWCVPPATSSVAPARILR